MSKCKAQGLFIKYALCALLSVYSVSSIAAANSVVPSTEKSWLYGAIFGSMAVGAFSTVVAWYTKLVHAYITELVHESRVWPKPQGKKQAEFSEIIARAGLNPCDVAICYRRMEGRGAMAAQNTIVIDPESWTGLAEDDENAGLKAGDVVARKPYLEIPISAQNFVLRHELGHVKAQQGPYDLILVPAGIATALATLTGVAAALYLQKNRASFILSTVGGLIAWGTMFCGSLLSSYGFWSRRTEKNADLFAAKNSSTEEIFAAADWFEDAESDYEEAEKECESIQVVNDVSNWFWSLFWKCMPATHPDGRTRAAYLRKVAQDRLLKEANGHRGQHSLFHSNDFHSALPAA